MGETLGVDEIDKGLNDLIQKQTDHDMDLPKISIAPQAP